MKPAIEIAEETVGSDARTIARAIIAARREAYEDAIQRCDRERFVKRTPLGELTPIEHCVESIRQALWENCK